jgi:hypothetical protein
MARYSNIKGATEWELLSLVKGAPQCQAWTSRSPPAAMHRVAVQTFACPHI